MPSLEDILAKAGEAKVVSKLDLSKGFYQLMVEKELRDKTTFCIPFGKFRFRRIPFGLKNTPAHFQRMVKEVVRPCAEFSSPYIDDILIFSADVTEHLSHIRQVLQMFKEAEHTARPSKCQWNAGP